jgi:hypothetical protein
VNNEENSHKNDNSKNEENEGHHKTIDRKLDKHKLGARAIQNIEM